MYVIDFEDAVQMNLTRFSKSNLRDARVQTVRNNDIIFMPQQRVIDFPLAAHYEKANYTVQGMERNRTRQEGKETDRNAGGFATRVA